MVCRKSLNFLLLVVAGGASSAAGALGSDVGAGKGLVSGAPRAACPTTCLSVEGGVQVATEQVGSGGRSGNHRGDPRNLTSVEI